MISVNKCASKILSNPSHRVRDDSELDRFLSRYFTVVFLVLLCFNIFRIAHASSFPFTDLINITCASHQIALIIRTVPHHSIYWSHFDSQSSIRFPY